ncbi:chemotaxis protein CheB [Dactylosporangium aurantiacum]|uniref:protein-glutamate methylesterase n=1 Tax=Dactylosporangium aurantiacum TaxID=35754 RepID=A0A9Q9MFG5_9ACTN|nr:chemotaxis protein CheB [Dactylosporangium aurantiacum]MDG6107464.1 chemotaxis protein CheB [Dactylosporangium aurantiacum]UWZ54414.1 chemotaxis protein CheB [Dactylosporangium aurantiacum]
MSAGAPTARAAARFDVVVIAASLGGPAALRAVLAALPADFPVPLLVVQHRTPMIDDQFVHALRYRTRLPVRAVADGDPVDTPGIGVLPARQTATVDAAGRLRLRTVDGYRTADPLLADIAVYCGPRALCVVLTGRLDDAAAGVRAVRRHGGRTIVQQPSTAQAPGMPAAALATGCVDLTVPLSRIPACLVALAMAPDAAEPFRVAAPSPADLAV